MTALGGLRSTSATRLMTSITSASTRVETAAART
jgi:hypothetical protein